MTGTGFILVRDGGDPDFSPLGDTEDADPHAGFPLEQADHGPRQIRRPEDLAEGCNYWVNSDAVPLGQVRITGTVFYRAGEPMVAVYRLADGVTVDLSLCGAGMVAYPCGHWHPTNWISKT
jgi:hypothetical protein